MRYVDSGKSLFFIFAVNFVLILSSLIPDFWSSKLFVKSSLAGAPANSRYVPVRAGRDTANISFVFFHFEFAHPQKTFQTCCMFSSISLGICGLPPPDVLGENSIAVLTCSGNIICSYCSISQYYLLYADFLSLIVLITKSNFIGISYITEVFITSKHA